MGEKSRSNFAPSGSMTKERFDAIFKSFPESHVPLCSVSKTGCHHNNHYFPYNCDKSDNECAIRNDDRYCYAVDDNGLCHLNSKSWCSNMNMATLECNAHKKTLSFFIGSR